MTGFTTRELILDEVARTGIPEDQLMLVVAKSAVIRHLATHPDYKHEFVLKGGTLLRHVYSSTRMSIADADFTHLEPAALSLPALQTALAIPGQDGFAFRPEDGSWSTSGGLFSGERLPFKVTVPGLTHDDRLKLTVCVRKGERIDTPDGILIYHDPLLSTNKTFAVEGLTLNELAAEKMLGWVSKETLPKHFLDLAIIARDHAPKIDHDRVAYLVKRKYGYEGRSPRYLEAGIRRLEDIPRVFQAPAKLAELRTLWDAAFSKDLFLVDDFDSSEEDLSDLARVELLVDGFWEPSLGTLAPHRTSRR